MAAEAIVHQPEGSDAWLRVWRDIVKRAMPGIFIYPIFWAVIAASSGFHKLHPALSWSVVAALTGISIVRLINAIYLTRVQPEKRQVWQGLFWFGILAHSGIYGSMFALSLLSGNAQFSLLMAFSGAGIVAGGVNSFSPSRNLAYAYAIVFLSPGIVVALWSQDLWVEAGFIVTYLFYMWNLVRQQNAEYWVSLNNERTLALQSRTDSLTTLNNRRYFDEKLKELCHLSSRDHMNLSILVLDCDFFKAVNDKYGHDFGDECLRQVANVLTTNLPRATDVCARYGGEEFSIILAGTDLQGAQLVAEKIRNKIEKMEIKYKNITTKVTISVGLVSVRLDNFEVGLPERLFKYADEALYLAKEQGRNRVVCSVASTALQAGKVKTASL
ncbi:GGDEF domain-containing protein [Simiduia curdlanivorans]|uniref:diguanylate cyclase n=1 Tax=Simiduia curdlanivorans TaxID=1492769 RepID=A0ABV8V4V2_9GAMM|nr:GGDEF domain-containing protein [Simiduia curdlanivorans]MDN3638211.1 GGDEF domain-containing protein [Simiduia curdlanivorans]